MDISMDSIATCAADCHSLVMKFKLAENAVERALNEQYEEALAELNYMLDNGQQIRQQIEALKMKTRHMIPSESVCEELAAPSTVSRVPSSLSTHEETEQSLVESFPPVPVAERREKTEYEKVRDQFYNRGQSNVLRRAQAKLKNLEVTIGRLAVKLGLVNADGRMVQAAVDILQNKTAVLLDNKYKTIYKLGSLRPHLQCYQELSKRNARRVRINVDKIRALKAKLRTQADEKTRIRRAKQRPVRMVAAHHRENIRQTDEYVHLLETFNHVEAETRDLKQRINCEANMRIFYIDKKRESPAEVEPLGFYWIEKETPKYARDVKKRTAVTEPSNRNRSVKANANTGQLAHKSARTKTNKATPHSPDYLREFKAKLGQLSEPTLISRDFTSTSAPDVEYCLLKKRAAKNFPLRMTQVSLAKDLTREEYLLRKAEETEDLLKRKYAQLEKDLEKVVQFRVYCEESEANIRLDIEHAFRQ